MADDAGVSAMEASVVEKMRKVHWVPLESNPEMLNDFGGKVGMNAGWQFCDVFGVDEELLAMVPQPCIAVTLLFGFSENLSKAKAEQAERIEKEGQKVSEKLVYLKQYVGNACGTIAASHILMNTSDQCPLVPNSPIANFLESIRGNSPEEAGAKLADATELHTASEDSAQGGQTVAPEASAATDAHFIAFVEKDGDLYELDGGKKFPINHGPTSGNFLLAATRTIKTQFMDKDPENLRFNIMALSQAQ
eukprot:TRINITY_DN3406_c0_g1_i1.p1 TRINITY_DN3406_c0_g1~~TRINITY_DN3406_c0_g1_i1.p1  ORF type:complete len:249 (-),score=48.36 TRINITY_DN3406_c0_g1_i1:372-1118(-)